MDLQGNLKQENLQEVLQKISLSRESGELILEKADEKGVIFFRKGLIAAACMTNILECLEEKFLKNRLISDFEWNSALNKYSNYEKHDAFVHMLVETNLISSKAAINILEQHTKKSIFKLLSWQDGEYNFTSKPVPNPNLLSLRIEHLLMEWSQFLEEHKDGIVDEDLIDFSEEATEDLFEEEEKFVKAIEKKFSQDEVEKLILGGSEINSLAQILNLFAKLNDVAYACILSPDGLYQGSDSEEFEFHYTVGALASNALGMIRSFSDELLKNDELKSIYLKFHEYIIVFQIFNPNISLLIIGKNGVNLEYIRWLSLKAKDKILKLIEY